ncbi:hypothetical protein HGRIS_004059 [Hohenbuehelia grisea]|uniref:F-box protein n=1 Tax=Hohenbuehelia grisea TaxID=104357 RepID=A0ABR3JHB8_9AGAR
MPSTVFDPARSSPIFPAEIIDRILQLALLEHQGNSGRDWERNVLRPILSFSQASKAFRQLALRRFLQDIRFSGEGRSLRLLLESVEVSSAGQLGYRSVRTLRTNARTLSFNFRLLSSFIRLQALSIDMGSEGFLTQNCVLKAFCKSLPVPSVGISQLTTLKLTFLPRIDTALLRLLAQYAPTLVDLHLGCSERIFYDCCWSCCIDTSDCTIHSPIPDMYTNADDLAVDFAFALKPMSHLTRLHLGIFLSPEQIFYEHMNHDEYAVASPLDDCDICLGNSRLIDYTVRIELEASLIMAKQLKSLRRVSWSSWFGDRVPCTWNDEHEAVDDVLAGPPKAVVWVLRMAGRVRVKRGESW